MAKAKTVTAIIDIGKTNKKFYLFDEELDEISHEYIRFNEIEDDDGFPGDDLDAIISWTRQCISSVIEHSDYDLKSLNFSTYGASLVHLDNGLNPITPFYNYLKGMDPAIVRSFLTLNGLNESELSRATSSPLMGYLNSGLQIVDIKYKKSWLFNKIAHTIHFPQYLSFLFTRQLVSEYTSIGCHTVLWDFSKGNYHRWVGHEEIDRLLPQIVSSHKSYDVIIQGKEIKTGVGLHDSSSALIPYLQASPDPFILISTGTWSICMNYFNESELNDQDLEKDCLHFLSTVGTNIKASRLYLGKHMSVRAKELSEFFGTEYRKYKAINFDPAFTSKRLDRKELFFDHSMLNPERFGFRSAARSLDIFSSYQDAYHHLVDELTDLQIASLKLVMGNSKTKIIYVDGGFSGNEVFMQMLANKLPNYKVYASSFAKGTALGAALLVNEVQLAKNYLFNHYNLTLFKPILNGMYTSHT